MLCCVQQAAGASNGERHYRQNKEQPDQAAAQQAQSACLAASECRCELGRVRAPAQHPAPSAWLLQKLITKHSSSGPASPRRGLPQAVRPKGKKPANHLDAEQSPLESAGGSTIPAFVQLSAPEAASVPQGNACIKVRCSCSKEVGLCG